MLILLARGPTLRSKALDDLEFLSIRKIGPLRANTGNSGPGLGDCKALHGIGLKGVGSCLFS